MVRFDCGQAVSIVLGYKSRKKSTKSFLFVASDVKIILAMSWFSAVHHNVKKLFKLNPFLLIGLCPVSLLGRTIVVSAMNQRRDVQYQNARKAVAELTPGERPGDIEVILKGYSKTWDWNFPLVAAN
jgi:hypothetical protein